MTERLLTAMEPVPRIIELSDYSTHELPSERLTAAQADRIGSCYSEYMELRDPVPRLGTGWKLRSKGWAGILPIGDDDRIVLTPRVPVRNLFRMLAIAYRMDVKALPGSAEWTRCDELFEALLQVLAKLVLQRARRGLHCEYVPQTGELPYVRGQLLVRNMIRHPAASARVSCRYGERTADIPDNRIPAWALASALRSALCTERSRAEVRSAYRVLAGTVTVEPVSARACVGRYYHRLNADYELIHALCRFVLENTGHTHHTGEAETVPFLINTPRLFEMFVTQWLHIHLPPGLCAHTQETFRLSEDHDATGRIDLVITERTTGRARLVLDMKYKVDDKPAPGDIHQAVTYAVARGCSEAVLIYPKKSPFMGRNEFNRHGIRVRTAAFPLDGDLDQAGLRLLEELGLAAE